MPAPAREHDAGVTLVEVLVVLALIGTVSGAVGLAVGSVDRGRGAAQEAQLLAARLNRAADEALTSEQRVAFVWEDATYRFLADDAQGWVTHPVAILGEAHSLGTGLRFLGANRSGRYVVSADLLPESGDALTLAIGRSGDTQVAVTFDGMSARLPGDDGS